MKHSEAGAAPALAGAAFEDVYLRTYGHLMAVAVATVRDRDLAEDLVQDTYAQLWVHWATVSQPQAWLRRAVVNNCLSALRTQRRRDAILRRHSRVSTPVTAAESEFLDLLSGLNARQRIAITLRYVEDLSEAEIALALGCRPGTVKSTLHRAIATLRIRMERRGS
ncbi:sigma-70 family RNA polymerase sigma factor [Knoellia sp. S7-12]|uniref:RNA polymerase sigma factor n=1 Tax=Knoellia sp. S7-12 TaxID=3126698 RepID=UPI0033672D95